MCVLGTLLGSQVVVFSGLGRWHDAGTYDANSKTGGPNGSIRNEEEYSYGANSGLKIAIDLCGMFYVLLLCGLELRVITLFKLKLFY